MKKDTIAIIGAGEAALPIIQKANDLGICTLAFGRSDSFAKKYVDIFIKEESFDIDFMAMKCRENKVNGIMASSELTTEIAAKLASALRLPGNSIQGGFAGKNKFIMRNRVSNLNTIRQPSFELFTEEREYTFPVVVKPVDAYGKRGVCLVQNNKELSIAIKTAKENSSNGSVLIEQYLEGGQEYSIECISDGEKHVIVQYTEKESSGPPHFVEIAHHQPALLTEELKKRINIAVSDVLDALGLYVGMAHLELKVINNELYFIEVGARHGGDQIGDVLTVNSTDFDYFKAAIECALGKFQPKQANNVAYTGIYFHNKYNSSLKPLFIKAQTAEWCIVNKVISSEFKDVSSNIESTNAGYFIYKSDHKITLKDVYFDVMILNNHSNVKKLISDHFVEIGSTLSQNKANEAIDKFLNKGHVIGVIEKGRIIGFLLLYCTFTESKDAYICNVYVSKQYRGLRLCNQMLQKSYEICIKKGFKTVSLHVDDDNISAIRAYERDGFASTGNTEISGKKRRIEMRRQI